MLCLHTVNLFHFDEIRLFALYSLLSSTYKKFTDVGANVGLHSIYVSQLGYEVNAFEPDPIHYKCLVKNVSKDIEAWQLAVGSENHAAVY